MGYALLAETADGRKWLVARGRKLTNDPARAMYYPHPGPADEAVRGLANKLRHSDLRIVAAHRVVRYRFAPAVWADWLRTGQLDTRSKTVDLPTD